MEYKTTQNTELQNQYTEVENAKYWVTKEFLVTEIGRGRSVDLYAWYQSLL